MKRFWDGLVVCAVLILVAMPLHAQSGCTDSPENPTVVLAIVGGVGAMFSAVRARMKARKRTKEQSKRCQV